MKVKTILDETFQDYRKCSMLISACYCDWKCELEDELAIKTDWLFVNNEKTWK
jgi:putative AlgH/UPF0301 family transcriptional regulator